MDFFLNIPILCVLLLTAGVLLGHMIWGRARSEGEEKVQRLREQNEGLQKDLEDQKSAFGQLEKSLELHRKDAARFKTTNRQLEHLREQHRTLQEALAQAEQNATRVQTLSEKLQSHVANFHEERDQFVEAVQIRLQDQSKQIERLSAERDEAVSDLGKSRAEVTGLEAKIKHQSVELEELRAKSSRSSGLENDVTDLRRKLEDLNSEYNREKNQREHLQSVLDGRKIEYDALLQDIEKLESSFQSMCLQNEKLTEESSLLATLRIEQTELCKDLESAKRSNQTLADEKSSIAKEYAELHDSYESLKGEQKVAASENQGLRGDNEKLEHELDRLKKELDRLETKYDTVGEAKSSLFTELGELKLQYNEGLRQYREVCDERDSLVSTKSNLETANSDKEKAIEELRSQLASANDLHSQIDELRSEVESVDNLRLQLDDKTKHIEIIALELDALEDEKVSAEGRVKELEKIHDESRQEIEALRNELASVTELKSQLVDQSQRIELIAGERTEIVEAKSNVEKRVAELEQDLETQSRSLVDLTEKYDEKCEKLNQASDECEKAIAAHEEASVRIVKLESRITELERVRHEVETELHEAKAMYSEKSKEHSDAILECDELITANEKADEKLAKLDERIEELERIRDAAEADYQDLKGKYDAKLDELKAVEEERDAANEEQRVAQDEIIVLKRQIVEATDAHEVVSAELAQVDSKYSQVTEQLKDECSARDEMTRLYKESEDVVVILRQQLEELESVHGSKDVDVAELKAKLEAKVSELDDVRVARDEITESYKSSQQTILDLKQQIVEFEESKGDIEVELTTLRASYEACVRDLEAAGKSREEIGVRYEKSESTIVILREQIKQLEAVSGTTDTDLAELQAKYDEKVRELEDVVESRTVAVEANSEAENKITRLEVRVQQLEKIREEANSELIELRNRLSQAGDLKRSLAEQNRRLEILVGEKDLVAKSKSEVELRLSQLESELDQQNRSFQTITQQHEQLQAKLKVENERYELAAEELESQRKRVEQLESELEEFEVLRQEHVQLQAQLTDIKDRLIRMTEERDELRSSHNKLEGRVVSLRRHNVANEDTIRDLRRERMAVIERLRNRAFASQETELKVVRFEEAGAKGGQMEHDDSLGMIYTEAPDDPDDLKLIYGIATVLEQKLNDFGVYTYRQIMDWDEPTIEEFSNRLSFKDRIQRDQWIVQASRLHEEKYGASKAA